MSVAPAYAKVPNRQSLFSEADKVYEGLKTSLSDTTTLGMKHDEVEQLIEVRGREILRGLFQAHLELRSYSEVVEPVVGSDDRERTHRRSGEEKTLTSVFGDVTVRRDRYEGRGLSSLCPLDGDLNLPLEQYSLEVRRKAAKKAVYGSFENTLEDLYEIIGRKIPKRQFEEMVKRAARDFDAFYEATAVAEFPVMTSPLLVLTFDGKGIVMRKDCLRKCTQKKASKEKHKLQSRLAKGEKKNRKRMAEVAAVYTIGPNLRTPDDVVAALWREEGHVHQQRPRPENKRVWASVVKEQKKVIKEAFAEAMTRDPLKRKTWVVLVDGDPRQLKIIRKVARKLDVKIFILCDVIHVLEYLWKAAYVFNPEGSSDAESWVRERLCRILNGEAGLVAGGIRRSATKRGLKTKTRKPADRCAHYLTNHLNYLRYDEALRQGFSISTGVIEGACRHLIRDRMELTGCRWSLDGAEAILRLRALILSGDFDDYWLFHREQELIRNHLTRYAGQRLPSMARPSPGRRLRVVA